MPAGSEEVLFCGDRELRLVEDESVPELCLDRFVRDRADHLVRASEGTVAATRHDDPVAEGLQLAEPRRELLRVPLRGLPAAEAYVDAFGELAEVEPGPPRDRVVERRDRGRTRPPDGIGEGLRLLVGLVRAVDSSPGARDRHPPAVR